MQQLENMASEIPGMQFRIAGVVKFASLGAREESDANLI